MVNKKKDSSIYYKCPLCGTIYLANSEIEIMQTRFCDSCNTVVKMELHYLDDLDKKKRTCLDDLDKKKRT